MQSDSKRACRLWGDPDVTTTMAGLEADPWSDHRVWFDHNMGWWGYAGMGAGMVLFWALVVAGIVAWWCCVRRPAEAAVAAVSGADTGRAGSCEVRSAKPSTGIASPFCAILPGTDEIRVAPAALDGRYGLHRLIDMLTATGPPSLTAVGTADVIAHGLSGRVSIQRAH